MPKPIRLDPALRQQILAALRSGGYPHVAAAAFGVPPEVLDDWLKRGAAPKAREPYASFAAEVHEACAQARLRAEMAAFKDNPRVWLEHGPGRETLEVPGWSTAVPPAETAAVERPPLLNDELLTLFHQVLEALADFPDARTRVSAVLMKNNIPL